MAEIPVAHAVVVQLGLQVELQLLLGGHFLGRWGNFVIEFLVLDLFVDHLDVVLTFLDVVLQNQVRAELLLLVYLLDTLVVVFAVQLDVNPLLQQVFLQRSPHHVRVVVAAHLSVAFSSVDLTLRLFTSLIIIFIIIIYKINI